MKFLISRSSLYPVLQKVVSIISVRPRLSILNHILLEISKNYLFIIATDLEIEIRAQILLDDIYESESTTISGRKFFEICRNLSEHSKISIISKNNKLHISSKCSNFSLSMIDASSYPKIKSWENKPDIVILQFTLKKMIKLIQFSMGYQDARYYLNGMLLEVKDNTIRMVATDGHRLAMCEIIVDSVLPSKSVIIPRKSVLEILHLLNSNKDLVRIQIDNNCIYMQIDNYIFNSKLIDSVFPNYQKIFSDQPKFFFEVERVIFKQALKRASILCNVKFRMINLKLTMDSLKITAYNFEQETSEEILNIIYSFQDIEISFNVDYLLDVINVIDTNTVKIFLTDEISSIQIESVPKCYGAVYVIMPIQV